MAHSKLSNTCVSPAIRTSKHLSYSLPQTSQTETCPLPPNRFVIRLFAVCITHLFLKFYSLHSDRSSIQLFNGILFHTQIYFILTHGHHPLDRDEFLPICDQAFGNEQMRDLIHRGVGNHAYDVAYIFSVRGDYGSAFSHRHRSSWNILFDPSDELFILS